ncbi:YceI family protein [Cytophagaceae bacterium ABcell3]|nr:YceI family protein [Cytophagaceae bacterium ABcell3]
MKVRHIVFGLMASVALYSCGGSQDNTEQSSAKKAVVEENEGAEELSLVVDTEASNVKWKGTMIKIKHHAGDLKLKEGNLVVKGNSVTGGSFTADLSSIKPTDDNYDEENTPSKLVGHLSSDDFFDVENYPEATFVINEVEGNTLVGDLTVRGITNEEKVTDVVVEEVDGVVTASGKLVFDRQDYEVAWSSGMKDVVLADDIELEISLVSKK